MKQCHLIYLFINILHIPFYAFLNKSSTTNLFFSTKTSQRMTKIFIFSQILKHSKKDNIITAP